MHDKSFLQLTTVNQFLQWISDYFAANDIFFGHGTDNPWDEAVVLVTHVIGLDPFVNADAGELVLDEQQKRRLYELVTRRVEQRIPAPYLVGEAWFCGLRFLVNESVLIPRSPIAELIEQSFQPWLTEPPKRILDLCCGSGCIGIACAYAFPEAEVVMSDISPEALEIAQQNIALHQLGNRVTAIESDLYGNLGHEKFDLIISNSPYVNAQDFAEMPPEYHHEPSLALESGNDGLDFTRRLLAESHKHLTEDGILVAEVGNSWLDLDAAYPQLPFTWLEFEYGGHGVFLLNKSLLQA